MGWNPVHGAKKVGKSVGHSVSHAFSSVGHTAGKIGSTGARFVKRGAHNKFIRFGVGWYTGNVFTGAYAYLRGTQDAQNMYNVATGHYQRQQARIERDMQRQQERMEKQQRDYAFKQRKEQVDALRERIGVCGSRYRTDRQDRTTSSLWGSGKSGETLG